MVGMRVSGAEGEGGGGKLMIKKEKLLGSSALSTRLSAAAGLGLSQGARGRHPTASPFCLLLTTTLSNGHAIEFI